MKVRWLLATVMVLAWALPATAAPRLFVFNELAGIPVANVTVRDIPGGGLPWTIEHGAARLTDDGRLIVEVKGLVLAAGPRAGTNPVAEFIATLSCLNPDGTINNIDSAPVPATVTGDAHIHQMLTLPETCLGPIVFVRGVLQPTPRWFAITGFAPEP